MSDEKIFGIGSRSGPVPTVVFFNFFLTKQTRIDQYAFLTGSHVFSRPYHLTHTALKWDFFSYGFPTKLRARLYLSYLSYDKNKY